MKALKFFGLLLLATCAIACGAPKGDTQVTPSDTMTPKAFQGGGHGAPGAPK